MSSKGTALVTGASTGIGAVYADRLAKRGYDLVLVARDEPRLQALAERLRGETGVTIDVLRADLTDRGDLARVAERLERDSSITLLVNNAGMTMRTGLLEASTDALDKIIALNVTAPTILAGAAGRGFVKRGTGAIVNIASVLGLFPEHFEAVYGGTKGYIINLSYTLAAQLADKGVYVQAVLPGATRTEIWERGGANVDDLPPEMVMEVDDLVDAALVGFDRRETVTIPPLADESLWTAFSDARQAMGPHLSKRDPAPRYRQTVDA